MQAVQRLQPFVRPANKGVLHGVTKKRYKIDPAAGIAPAQMSKRRNGGGIIYPLL